jgi:hypothetical protein
MTQQITSLSPPPAPPLLLPDGRAVDTVPHGELYGILADLQIVGFDHRNGLTTNIALYQAHVNHLAAVAGKEAVAAWLAANNKGV